MNPIIILRQLLAKPHYVVEGFKPEYFLPDEELDSLADVNPCRLVNKGIEGLVIDLDQVLMKGYSSLKVDRKINPYLKALEEIFSIGYLSNNCNIEREKRLEPEVRNKLIKIKKPKPSYCSFQQALDYLGLPAEKTVMIGDLVYIDISAANKLGMYTIQVKPLNPKKDPASIWGWRKIENWFKKKYSAK